MSHEIRVLCRPAVAVGFRLASLRVLVAADAAAAAARLETLRRDPAVGLVLVEDTLHTQLPPEEARASGAALPIVVPFPGPSWKAPGSAAEARILEILRRALGYRVRLR